MAKRFAIFLFMLPATMLVINGEKCGYVPGPFALTNDTVVINLDCKRTTPSTHHAIIKELQGNVTHVAIQLLYCHNVPVGLFTNVTDNLTSVTLASEDGVQLLDGTFNGLERVTELRLLGFAALKNLSRSVFEPLRNIETLVLDRFGQRHITMSDLGNTIQQLSGSPIKELVMTNIRSIVEQKDDRILHMNDFSIKNASVKRLVVTGVQLNYGHSIRRAFPALVSFCGVKDSRQNMETRPVLSDLLFLSDTLINFTVYLSEDSESQPKLQNITTDKVLAAELPQLLIDFRDLYKYFLTISKSDACLGGRRFKLGAHVSRITINDIPLIPNIMDKPVCFDEGNKLEYVDLAGSPVPKDFPGVTGLSVLKYLSFENTGIENVPRNFLGNFPSLQVLKLSKLGIKNIIVTADDDFFGLCPELRELYLDNCKLTSIPPAAFSRLHRLQRIDVSNNFLQKFDVDLHNCTELSFVNVRSNNLRNIPQERVSQLNNLLKKRSNNVPLLIDLSFNALSCQCNSTYFVKWLKRSAAESNIKFLQLENYECSYPNVSVVRLSEVSISELDERCNVIDKFVNASSDCPCDEETQRRLRDVRMSLDGLFCKKDDGNLFAMKGLQFPSCFDPLRRPSFIVPVVAGGILAIIVLIMIGFLYYHRHRKPVRQIRECLEMNPVHFVRAALQYMMLHNHAEEYAMFDYEIMVFAQDDDRSSVHGHFLEALQGRRKVISRDDFLPGAAEVEAMAECIRVCRWIVPVITSNFLSDPVCVDFINRAQFSRPHALIPVVWEQVPAAIDVSVAELLRVGDPLYWPGDLADVDDKRIFWSSLLERTA